MSEPGFLKLIQSRGFTIKITLDSAGRKGKSVTVLNGLPKQELFLKELLKSLKQMCGAGGTYSTKGKEGVVEVQGDHREKIAAYLQQFEFKIK